MKKKAHELQEFIRLLFISESSKSTTNSSSRRKLHHLNVEKQNNLALNPFDDERMYIEPTKQLPWDKHTQCGTCQCFLSIKHIGLCFKEIVGSKSDGK